MCGNRQKVETRTKWDDKFGLIDGVELHHEFDDLEENYTQRMKEQEAAKIIEGVGKDAEVVTNKNGGKQSKSPMAMHLLDPQYLFDMATEEITAIRYKNEDRAIVDDKEAYTIYSAIKYIASYMLELDGDFASKYLDFAMIELEEDTKQQIIRIAKVLQYGADRYEPNNWRLIPEEEHINHALIHLIAHLMGDTQDEHIDHALCRLMMARATKRSKDFSYTQYVKKTS